MKESRTIPFGEETSNLFVVIVPEFLAKTALEAGLMTQEQWDLKDTHALFVAGYWIGVSKSLPVTTTK